MIEINHKYVTSGFQEPFFSHRWQNVPWPLRFNKVNGILLRNLKICCADGSLLF